MAELISDVEVCGELSCQFRGTGEWVPVYVELGGGALSICKGSVRGGELISTAPVVDLAQLGVRPPTTARDGRPHCLRVDLPNGSPDSAGVRKYIFDLGSEENLGRWRRGLTGRLSTSGKGEQSGEAGSAASGGVGGWLTNIGLTLNLGDDDDMSRQVSLDLSPRARAMISHHKKAQLEVVHNSIVTAKRRNAAELDDGEWVHIDDAHAYAKWLQVSMPGDYDNEFVAHSRKNEVSHLGVKSPTRAALICVASRRCTSSGRPR